MSRAKLAESDVSTWTFAVDGIRLHAPEHAKEQVAADHGRDPDDLRATLLGDSGNDTKAVIVIDTSEL